MIDMLFYVRLNILAGYMIILQAILFKKQL